MIPYEIDFMGGAKNIMWPDANLFTDKHFEYLMRYIHSPISLSLQYVSLVAREERGRKDRRMIYRDYRYECLNSPLHELIHCIQTELGQSDSSSWTAEHGLYLPEAVIQTN